MSDSWPRDIVDSLRTIFPTVVTDEPRAARYVAEHVLALRKAGRLEESEALLAVLPDAVQVIATDSPKSDTRFLMIYLVPERRPALVFYSEEHLRDSQELIDQLPPSLSEYMIVRNWGRTADSASE